MLREYDAMLLGCFSILLGVQEANKKGLEHATSRAMAHSALCV